MEKLTLQEEEAMLSIWELNGGFVKQILENMKDQQMPYTTLASTIKNLEKKGYVQAIRYANAKRYEPLIAQKEYKARFMNHFVKDYFKSSYKDMVSFFIKQEKLSQEELQELMELIEQKED